MIFSIHFITKKMVLFKFYFNQVFFFPMSFTKSYYIFQVNKTSLYVFERIPIYGYFETVLQRTVGVFFNFDG